MDQGRPQLSSNKNGSRQDESSKVAYKAQHKLDLSLYAAALHDDALAFDAALRLGANPNWGNPDNDLKTCAHVVSERGHSRILRKILQHQATAQGKSRRNPVLHMRDKDGWSALHWASYKNRAEATQILLDAGADPKACDLRRRMPLYWTSSPINVFKLVLKSCQGQENGADIVKLAGRIGNVERLLGQNGSKAEKGSLLDLDAKGACDLVPLHLATVHRSARCAEALVRAGAALNIRDCGGKTPLHRAARSGSAEVARYLLGKNALSTARDNDGRLPLHDASYSGHLDVVRLLLAVDSADIDAREHDGSTPVLLASYAGHDVLVDFLIKRGASYEIQDMDGRTPLADAAANNHVRTVQILLAAGASISVKDSFGRTALHDACVNGHAEVVQKLISGARLDGAEDPSRQANLLMDYDEDGWTPLAEAISSGSLKSVELLLECGVSVNQAKYGGQCPLHIAAMRGDGEILKMLLRPDRGANMSIGDSNGDTPLHWACFRGFVECVRALMANPSANPEKRNADGGTSLHSAANNGNTEIGRILLSAKRNDPNFVNMQMDDGNAPLHNAAYEGHAEFAKLLLDHGATVDIVNLELRTPLHEAACTGNLNILILMLRYGADINRQDAGGDTALHWAVCNGHRRNCECLVNAGADLEMVNIDGGTPIMAAIINGEVECARVLITAGASVNARMLPPSLANHSDNANQQTPAAAAAAAEGCSMRDTCLHVAATDGLSSCILMLCNAGAILNAKNEAGRTPLAEAVRHRHFATAQILIDHGADIGAIDSLGRCPLQYMLGKDAMASESARLANLSLPAPPPPEWAGFSQMLGSEEFADLCLISSDVKRFSVHRIVLAARCTHFRALLSSGMRESTQDEIPLDLPGEVLEVILEYIYTGKVSRESLSSPELTMQIIETASMYTMDGLLQLASVSLSKLIDAENIMAIYRFACFHSSTNLQLACIDFFLTPSGAKSIMKASEKNRRHSHPNESGEAFDGGSTSSNQASRAHLSEYREIITDILQRKWRKGARFAHGNSVHKTSTRRGAKGLLHSSVIHANSDSNFARDGGYDLHESSVVAVDDDDDDDDIDDDDEEEDEVDDDNDDDEDDEIFADFEEVEREAQEMLEEDDMGGVGGGHTADFNHAVHLEMLHMGAAEP
eukprot:g1960.t1